MRRGTTGAIAGAIASALLLSACGSNGSEATEAPTETVAPTPAASPTASPTPSPTPEAELPEPPERLTDEELSISSEAEVQTVVERIIDFRQELFAHPTERKLISAIFWPECNCAEVMRETMFNLAEEGLRVEQLGEAEVSQVTIVSRTENSYTFDFTWRSPAIQILNEAGEVLETRNEDGQENSERWTIARDLSGRYRVVNAS